MPKLTMVNSAIVRRVLVGNHVEIEVIPIHKVAPLLYLAEMPHFALVVFDGVPFDWNCFRGFTTPTPTISSYLQALSDCMVLLHTREVDMSLQPLGLPIRLQAAIQLAATIKPDKGEFISRELDSGILTNLSAFMHPRQGEGFSSIIKECDNMQISMKESDEGDQLELIIRVYNEADLNRYLAEYLDMLTTRCISARGSGFEVFITLVSIQPRFTRKYRLHEFSPQGIMNAIRSAAGGTAHEQRMTTPESFGKAQN